MNAQAGDAVKVENLVVRYDRTLALDGVTLDVHFGEAMGIIGPNGSGKSTLLKSIAGLLTPSSGEITVLGTQPKKIPAGATRLRAADRGRGLDVPRERVGRRRNGALSAPAFLAALRRKRSATRSKKRCVRSTCTICADGTSPNSPADSSSASSWRARSPSEPQLLLLDEPTTGVDAETEEALRKVVRSLVDDGMPVLMTTHDLDRVGEWFDRLLVLDRRVLAIGTPDEVVESGAYASIREHTHTHGHARSV